MAFLPMLFVIGGVVLMYMYVGTRTGTIEQVLPTPRMQSVPARGDIASVFAQIVQAAPGAGLSVDAKELDTGRILLASGVTMFTWGFFYPVMIKVDPAGTRVEVGIKSKLFQWGPLVTRAHDKVVALVESAVS